jgi:hypothetical protein
MSSWGIGEVARINGELPTYFKITAAYDGVEVTECMGPEGVVYNREGGYVKVEKGEDVLVWPGTETGGHGGNRFDDYVWCMTLEPVCGWLPSELLHHLSWEHSGALEATGPLPEETAASASTGPLPEEMAPTGPLPEETAASAAIAATGPPPVARPSTYDDFEC